MVQPCPECFHAPHKLSCDIGQRQRRRAARDREAIAYGFDVPAELLGGNDVGCPPTATGDGGGTSSCGGE